MTSRSGVDAIVRELRFGASPAGAPADPAERPTGAGARFRWVVDFDAPERWPDVDYDTAAPAARPDPAARARCRALLDEAAQTMSRRVPAAFRLVDTQLQRVLLRHSERSPGTSTSHRAHVGSCLLTNLHQPAEGAVVAIEALTHESIHQLIYRKEQAEGPFCDLSETPTFRSPWSGARLPMHSLIHASFVWFGLLTLWSELAREPGSDTEAAHARGRIAHCLFGFAFLDDLFDSPAFPSERVDPRVLDALRGLSAETLRATRAGEPQATLQELATARESTQWPAALAAEMAPDPR